MTISRSFSRMLTVTASTKRPPEFTGAKRGVAVTNLATILCTNLLPASVQSQQTFQRSGLNTPYVLLETYCADTNDIKAGDYLVVTGREYPVKMVQEWMGSGLMTLILEDLLHKKPV